MLSNIPLTDAILNEFIDQNTIRHSIAKPPKPAYLFFPSENYFVEYDPKNKQKTLRRIFEIKQPYLDFENEKIKEFLDNLEKNSKEVLKKSFELPEDYKQSELLRFIQATGYNCKESLRLISNNIDWKSYFFPINLTNPAKEILNSGFIYCHGRDYHYRPMLVIDLNIYLKNKKKYSFDDWIQSVIYFIDYTINNLLIPGQIENWNIICDLGKVSLLSPPSELKKVIGVLQSNFRCRLYRAFVIGMNGFLKAIYGMIKGLLDQSTQRKVKFLDKNCFDEIFEITSKNQIEIKYGGNCENIENYYFPPIMPDNERIQEGNTSENFHVTEQEYLEKLKKGEVSSPLKEMEEVLFKMIKRNKVNDIDISENSIPSSLYGESNYETCREELSKSIFVFFIFLVDSFCQITDNLVLDAEYSHKNQCLMTKNHYSSKSITNSMKIISNSPKILFNDEKNTDNTDCLLKTKAGNNKNLKLTDLVLDEALPEETKEENEINDNLYDNKQEEDVRMETNGANIKCCKGARQDCLLF